MGETIRGAYVEILAGIAEPPIILGRDLVGDVLNGPAVTLADVTHEVALWRHSRGAVEPVKGPLTDIRIGRADVRIYDPTRRYDPTNPDGSRIAFGAAIELWVDGNICFRGTLQAMTYSHMRGISGWIVDDGVAKAQATAVVWDQAAGTTFDQYDAILNLLGVPADGRRIYGSPTQSRAAPDPAATVTSPGWELLREIRLAELGDLWIDRRGRWSYRGRSVEPDDTIRATIGADGIACDGLFVNHDRAALVTGVNLTMADGDLRERADADAELVHGERRIGVTEDRLRLA